MTHAYESSREANLLCALALAVGDRLQLAAERAAGLGGSAPAALLTLDSPAGGSSIDALRRALALSHSGAVRLVDRLAAAGLVERRPGRDQRSVALALTPRGRRAVGRIRSSRQAITDEFLRLLTDDHRLLLTMVQERLLAAVDEYGEETGWVCRLCDRYACRHGRGGCPVEEATRRRAPEAAG